MKKHKLIIAPKASRKSLQRALQEHNINPNMIYRGSAERRMDFLLTYKEGKKIADNPETFLVDDENE